MRINLSCFSYLILIYAASCFYTEVAVNYYDVMDIRCLFSCFCIVKKQLVEELYVNITSCFCDLMTF